MSERVLFRICPNHDPHIAQCDYCEQVQEFSTEREIHKALVRLVKAASTLEKLGLLAESANDTDSVKFLRKDFLQKLQAAEGYC